MTKSSTPKVPAGQAPDTQRKAAPKVAAEKVRDAHRKAAPKAAAEKRYDAHRKTAPNGSAERVRDTHRETTLKVTPEKARDTHSETAAQFEQFPDTRVPDSMVALVQKSVAQARELFERSRNTLHAASEGAVMLNRKIIEITERNISTGFDLAARLAEVKNLAEVMEVQAAYWRNRFADLSAQFEEVRALSIEVAAKGRDIMWAKEFAARHPASTRPVEQTRTHHPDENHG